MYRAIVIAVMLLVGMMGPRGTTGVGATVWPAGRATTHRHTGTAHAAPAVNTVLLASRVKRPTTTPTQAPLPPTSTATRTPAPPTATATPTPRPPTSTATPTPRPATRTPTLPASATPTGTTSPVPA